MAVGHIEGMPRQKESAWQHFTVTKDASRDGKQVNTCKFCRKKLTSNIAGLKQHLLKCEKYIAWNNATYKIQDAEKYVKRIAYRAFCNECGCSFDTPATHAAHHPCFLRSEFHVQIRGREPVFHCPMEHEGVPCKNTFPDIVTLRNHMRFRMEKLFQCSLCPIKYATKRLTTEHVQRCHDVCSLRTPAPAEPLEPCPDCGAAFADTQSLEKHQEITGHGAECVVESVEYFEGEASMDEKEFEAYDENEGEEDANHEDGYSSSSSDPNDDPDGDPDFTADDEEPSTSYRHSLTKSITGYGYSSSLPSRSPDPAAGCGSGDRMRFPFKRGVGRPRKHPYPNSADRRQYNVTPADASTPSASGFLASMKRGPGRPRKHQTPYSAPTMALTYGRVSTSYNLRQHKSPTSTVTQDTGPAPEPKKTIPTATATSAKSDIAVLSSIKHCAACNAMFFQQADYDRHFEVHQKTEAAKVCVAIQTEDDSENLNKVPGSNSEQQDSCDSFTDAPAVITFPDVNESDYSEVD